MNLNIPVTFPSAEGKLTTATTTYWNDTTPQHARNNKFNATSVPFSPTNQAPNSAHAFSSRRTTTSYYYNHVLKRYRSTTSTQQQIQCYKLVFTGVRRALRQIQSHHVVRLRCFSYRLLFCFFRWPCNACSGIVPSFVTLATDNRW